VCVLEITWCACVCVLEKKRIARVCGVLENETHCPCVSVCVCARRTHLPPVSLLVSGKKLPPGQCYTARGGRTDGEVAEQVDGADGRVVCFVVQLERHLPLIVLRVRRSRERGEQGA
jgi:hypothetical protein